MAGKTIPKKALLQEIVELRHRLNRLEGSQDWLSYVEEELLSAEQEKAHLLNTIVEPIVYLAPDLQILWSNRAASVSLNLNPGQSVERNFLGDWAGENRPDLPVNEALRSGSPQEGEIVSLDGRVWHLRVYPVRGPQGGITCLLAAFLDITARKRAEEMMQSSLDKLQRAFEGVVQAMAMAMEMKDLYTSGHQQRVAQLACALAGELSLPAERIEGLRVAGLLHDLGKIAVASEILSKPGKINEYEFAIIKAHPQIGYDILKTIEFPWPVAQIVLQHHERLDGSGYPAGLKGEEILLEAKILGVSDVVEAMSSHRPYRPAIGINQALEEIFQKRGLAYDPEVVDACMRLFSGQGFMFE
ncbi:MAG: HD domain-containing protein [Deltaproteobacteria bacterium]|nr:HD domain-containing protein [Deltaproteobacteria bacterium]